MAISESPNQGSQTKSRVGVRGGPNTINTDCNSSGTTTSGNKTMDYTWMEPHHDPIATDTNLAEIDFEDFRNEDLAYAFSCGVSKAYQSH